MNFKYLEAIHTIPFADLIWDKQRIEASLAYSLPLDPIKIKKLTWQLLIIRKELNKRKIFHQEYCISTFEGLRS